MEKTGFLKVGNLLPSVDYRFSPPSQYCCTNMTKQERSGWQSLNFGIKWDTGVFCCSLWFLCWEDGDIFVAPSLSSSDPSIPKCWHFNPIQIPLPSFLSFPFSIQISLVDLQFTLRSLITFTGKSLSMYGARAHAANWSSFTSCFQRGM